jgi:hypothetical protein
VLRAELAARRALTHRWMDHGGRIRERSMAWSFLAEYTFVHYPTQVHALLFKLLPSWSILPVVQLMVTSEQLWPA